VQFAQQSTAAAFCRSAAASIFATVQLAEQAAATAAARTTDITAATCHCNGTETCC